MVSQAVPAPHSTRARLLNKEYARYAALAALHDRFTCDLGSAWEGYRQAVERATEQAASHRVVLSQRSAALKRHLQDHARSTNSSLLAEAKAQLAAVHKGGGGSGGGQLRRMLASMVGAGAGGEELDNR